CSAFANSTRAGRATCSSGYCVPSKARCCAWRRSCARRGNAATCRASGMWRTRSSRRRRASARCVCRDFVPKSRLQCDRRRSKACRRCSMTWTESSASCYKPCSHCGALQDEPHALFVCCPPKGRPGIDMILRSQPFAEDLPERPKVLLIDDDEVNLLLTSVALQEQGFAVTEAASGEQAIRVLADFLPDIIVLDAVMPGLDGFETCRKLRVLPGFESLPVLMLTGLDDDASITRAYEAGATDFFVKSTQWRLLAGRLRYLLRASRTRVELERSKSRLARAQDLARMGSFDWRKGQGGPMFSSEGLRVFGLGPDKRLDFRKLLRMVPDEERKAFVELTHSAIERSTVLATDIHARLVDGRQRIVHLEAEPEFNEHGNLVGYTGIVQDVTD